MFATLININTVLYDGGCLNPEGCRTVEETATFKGSGYANALVLLFCTMILSLGV